MKKATLIAAGLLYAAFSNVHAQAVYRCGNEYSQRPCAEGTALDVSDPRSVEQAAASRDKTERDAKLADRMEKDRLAQEKRFGGPVKMVIGLPPEPPKGVASAPKHPKKHGKEANGLETFKASSPAPAGKAGKSSKKKGQSKHN